MDAPSLIRGEEASYERLSVALGNGAPRDDEARPAVGDR
jgi:hypothetical protein